MKDYIKLKKGGEIELKLNKLFNEIDTLKKELDKLRPFSEEGSKNLYENFIVDITYNSNAIEGNTLTLQETKVVLEGITIGGKSLREHFEAINHKDALIFIEDLLKNGDLTELDIKQIHSLILKNIDDKNRGKYRDINVLISGAKHIPPKNIDVPIEMEKLIKWYYNNKKEIHPVELASRLHIDFVKIHPFIDGNGRTARILLNLELIKNGYPFVVIEKGDRMEYYKSLDLAHTEGDYRPFFNLINRCLKKSFEKYFFVLKGEMEC